MNIQYHVEFKGLPELQRKLNRVFKEFPKERDNFLRQQAELLRGRVVPLTPADTGLLRESWHRTEPANESIEVYNNTSYGGYVEAGFHQHRRWVPGHWQGSRFVYEPGAKTGMALRDREIEGVFMLRDAVDESKEQYNADARRFLARLFK